MALQALAEYAILSYVGGVNLTISLASTNLDYQETFELNKMNKKVLQTAVVGGFVQTDFFKAIHVGWVLSEDLDSDGKSKS